MAGTGPLADTSNANQSRQVFWDMGVHEREVERVVSCAWLFPDHESLLPKPGDFITTYMAEDEPQLAAKVIASRSADANWCSMPGSPRTRTSSFLLKTGHLAANREKLHGCLRRNY